MIVCDSVCVCVVACVYDRVRDGVYSVCKCVSVCLCRSQSVYVSAFVFVSESESESLFEAPPASNHAV